MSAMLLEGIPEGLFRIIKLDLINGTEEIVDDFKPDEAIKLADEFNGKRRLPIHPIMWVYNHLRVRVRTEKDVGEPVLGLG